jgi:hypothetical protein
MVFYDTRNGRSTRVPELLRKIVSDERDDLFGENDFLRNMIPDYALFGIRWNLPNSIKERDVSFHLLEDLHHVLDLLSLFPEMGRLFETLREWSLGLICRLKSGSG